jgi:hypothetical protein
VRYIQSRGGREHTQTPLAKPGTKKLIGQATRLVKKERLGENEMSLSGNNAGHTAFAMIINIALMATVFAGVVAAVSSLAA